MRITTVSDGVHLAETTLANWVILADGDSVALVDAGYPRQASAVEESVRRIGRRPEQIEAVLLAHAHVDHAGSVPYLAGRYGVRVLTSEIEARHARGEVRESATPIDVVRRSYDPWVAIWGVRAAAAGGTRQPRLPSVEAVEAGAPLDLPRAPVPVSLAGHTSGHTAYLLPTTGAIALGDALVTAHPASRTTGPQLLRSFFHHDEEQLRRSLIELTSVDADQLLPGHGPVVRLPLATAVGQALSQR